MASQRYERVSPNDAETPISPVIPSSPPPSFRSRASSPTRHAAVDQNLADAFDADGSDSDEENDGDDRQRLMRGTPTTSAEQTDSESFTTPASDDHGPMVVESRQTHIPVFMAPPPTANGRVYGGGSGSDGVFANLSAKPERGEKLEEHPPSYEQAAADAAPPYWETTILAPGMGGPDEVYIDGLPVGSVFSFLWNGMISMSFPWVGFILTYLLHTTHAAKNGSRAGLGITLVQYGFYMKGGASDSTPANGQDPTYQQPPDPNSHDFDPNAVNGNTAQGIGAGSGGWGDIATNDWLAYIMMIVGWFILIRAASDFLRARRHEALVLQSPERGLNVPIIAIGEEPATVV
ncbi:probable metal homeostasis protein [Rhynchosporium secalis]|uniref:Probable metal homeostasis protein n=1 Tax=Rhynchosporium secalis TaxID=38038 RepID=A0A1E1M014_RHYSE|nr:probable metal homeostasis protein [Rhynchosporium secalis]